MGDLEEWDIKVQTSFCAQLQEMHSGAMCNVGKANKRVSFGDSDANHIFSQTMKCDMILIAQKYIVNDEKS